MLIESQKGPMLHLEGIDKGVISDGDKFRRPDGSCERIINFDYDTLNGKAITRNSVIDSGLLSGFSMPDGYSLMENGVRIISFNEPIDIQVLLFCIQNSAGNVKIIVNRWYNPPGPNSEEPFKTNNYENHIKTKRSGWLTEFVDLTEYLGIVDFEITGESKFTVDASALTSDKEDYYRGWFVWNATKWNSDVLLDTKNKSFVCIDAFKDGIFTIQARSDLNLNNMEWRSGDECYLIRYPFVVHNANKTTQTGQGVDLNISFTPGESKWLLKTGTSIEILTGKPGNAWMGFINKDTAKETGYIEDYIVQNITFSNPEHNTAEVSGDPTSNEEHILEVKLDTKTEAYFGASWNIFDWTIIVNANTKFRMVTDLDPITYQQRFQANQTIRIIAPNNCTPNLNSSTWIVVSSQVNQIGQNRVEEVVTLNHISTSGNTANGGTAQRVNPNAVVWKWLKKKDSGSYETLFNGQSVLNTDYDIYEGVKIKFTSINFDVGDKVTIEIKKVLGGTTGLNEFKRFGWWLDYQQPPVMPYQSKLEDADSNIIYLSEKFGVKAEIAREIKADSKLTAFALLGIMDNRQRVILFKSYNLDMADSKAYRIKVQNYHGYSRRLTGFKRFGANVSDYLTDIKGYRDPNEGQYFNATSGRTLYEPIYGMSVNDTILMIDPSTGAISPQDGSYLEQQSLYSPEDPIFNKATLGIYTEGRLFLAGDSDYPDSILPSLRSREDVFNIASQQPVGSADDDRITALNILGVNPVVFKNGSVHIINIENRQEVEWRPIETKSKTGCNIPRSIARIGGAASGLSFGNDQGIWLMRDAGDPINLLKGKRLNEYLNIDASTKAGMFAEWYGEHSELWIGFGGSEFWVCKISPEESKLGWKNYRISGDFVGMETDESGNLYLYDGSNIFRYSNDYENESGENIYFEMETNLQVSGTRMDAFRCIEHLISVECETVSDGTGRDEKITIQILNEKDEVLQEKVKEWDPSTEDLRSIIFGNDKSNRQRGLKYKIFGTIKSLKRIGITEMNTRIGSVPQLWKSGKDLQ